MHHGDVVLLHGAFVGGWIFERLRAALSRRGWRTHAPDLPFHGSEFAGQPADPGLTGQGLQDYRAAMADVVRRLPGRPVLIGHSLGGLLAQMLAAEGLCRAAILLAPVAPWGLMPRSLEEVNGSLALLLRNGHMAQQAIPPDLTIAATFSMDKLPAALQRDTLRRMVPESGRALQEAILWWLDWRAASRVSFHRVQCPLLVLTGSDDRVTPPATSRAITQQYRGRAVFRELPGMSHFLFGEPNEEILFRDIGDWLAELPPA